MTVAIHFVRHCDVENPDGLIYGRLPGFPLSARGRTQAERVGLNLSDRPLVGIFSSPLLRAVQTARAVRNHHPALTLQISRRLLEVRTSYQGLRERDVPATVNMFDNPKEASDESIADVYRRMTAFLDWARRTMPTPEQGGEIVCVSHQAPIAILRAGLENRPLTVTSLRGPYEPKKGSITTVELDDDGRTSRISYREPTD